MTVATPEYVPLSEVPNVIPGRRPGKKLSIGTVWRWCRRGVHGGIRLRAVKVGGTLYTTREWILEFVRALNSDADVEPVRIRTRTQRERASQQAAEQLGRLWSSGPRTS